jgi:glutathione S-transferase
MQLYHHPFCASSRFIRCCLAEYGVDVALIVEDLHERKEEFLQLNPAGTLPVLMVEGVYPVSHVMTLMEYLEETYGGAVKLHPIHPLAKAEVRRLVAWFHEVMGVRLTIPYSEERIMKRFLPTDFGGGTPDMVTLRLAKQALPVHLEMMSWLIERRNWLGGDSLSFADFMAGAHLSLFDYFGDVPFNDFPLVKNWYARLKSRPSFRIILTDRVVGLPPVDHYANPDF